MCLILWSLQQVCGCPGRYVRCEVWDCQRALGTEFQTHIFTCPRTAPEEEDRDEALACIWGAGRGH